VLAVMPGSLDTAVNPDVNGAVNAIAVQPDGKIVIAGDFTQVGGQARGRIARLLPDGSLESTATFNPGSGANAAINALAIQPDGKILVGGTFTNFNGVLRSRLLRLEANGAPEGAGTWTQPTVTGTAVNAIAVQADGRIVIGGDFNAINATAAGRIARLSSAGVPEGSGAFNPGTGAANTVRAVAVQADGKILIGGDFTTVNGTGRNRLARLNTNGTLEGTGTFTPGTAAPASVRALLVQEDGRIVVAGDFSTFNGAAAGGIVRLGSNGVPEGAGAFNPGTGAGTTTSVRSLALHASGHILAGGAFTTFNGAAHGRLVMLRPDGTVESSSVFNAGTGANGIVASVAIGANGRLILGGSFTQVNGTARNRFAQLLHTPPVSTLAASSRLRLFWQLSGSAAAVSDVMFEQSVNGGVTWTPLGAGTRISGGWERTGLTLPQTGLVRARGRTPAGQGNPGAGLAEASATLNLAPNIVVSHTMAPAGVGAFWVSTGTAGGTTSPAVTFTVSNTGAGELFGVTTSLTGTHAARFTRNATSLPSVIPAGSNATFTVTFQAPLASGLSVATINVASDDPDTPLSSVNLQAQSWSTTGDQDGDGMTDWGEASLGSLGFNPASTQTALVNAYFAGAESNGLYSLAGLQAIQVDAPVIARDPLTGLFRITVGVQSAPSPTGAFTPFPMSAPQTLINPQGKLEFNFTLPGDGAVFRLEAQ
jgi:uncharacterized delta-60 repeat protein